MVVDASVYIAALTNTDPNGEWAESVIEEGSLAGPHLVVAETSNLIRRLLLAGEVSAVDAGNAHRKLLDLAIELYPFAPFGQRIWELRHNLTCYDAWYVAVAEMLDCPLLTLDGRLARATGPRCSIITPSGTS